MGELSLDPTAVSDRLRGNLRSLLDRLDEYGTNDPIGRARRESGNEASRLISSRVPLAHATGRAAFKSIAQLDRLLSLDLQIALGIRQEPAPDDLSVEFTLGTSDSVFTFAAPFRYPETSCGLLFRTDVESGEQIQAVATPFDSGGTIRHLRPKDSQEDQITFVREHELPVPGYREALQKHLAMLFTSPWDYIEGNDPDRPGPVETHGGDWRRWTFEVRFLDGLPLTGRLLAVFLPVAVASEETVLPRIVQWRRDQVDVEFYRTPRDGRWSQLLDMGVEYIRSHLDPNHG